MFSVCKENDQDDFAWQVFTQQGCQRCCCSPWSGMTYRRHQSMGVPVCPQGAGKDPVLLMVHPNTRHNLTLYPGNVLTMNFLLSFLLTPTAMNCLCSGSQGAVRSVTSKMLRSLQQCSLNVNPHYIN